MPGLTTFPPGSCAAFRADLRSLRQSFTSVLEFESPLLMVLFVAYLIKIAKEAARKQDKMPRDKQAIAA